MILIQGEWYPIMPEFKFKKDWNTQDESLYYRLAFYIHKRTGKVPNQYILQSVIQDINKPVTFIELMNYIDNVCHPLN